MNFQTVIATILNDLPEGFKITDELFCLISGIITLFDTTNEPVQNSVILALSAHLKSLSKAAK